jgi:hypothetical protein
MRSSRSSSELCLRKTWAGVARLAPPLSRWLLLAEGCMSRTWKQDKDGFSAQFITDWEGLVDLLASFQDGKWIYRGQSKDS